MGDEEELRARIEAQIAARHAELDGDTAAGGGRPLEPARPWLADRHDSAGESRDEAEHEAEHEGHPAAQPPADAPAVVGASRPLEPIRPWLFQQAAAGDDGVPGVPPYAEDQQSRAAPGASALRPARPWLRPAPEPADGDGPGAAAADGSGPAEVTVTSATAQPAPRRPDRPEPRLPPAALETPLEEPEPGSWLDRRRRARANRQGETEPPEHEAEPPQSEAEPPQDEAEPPQDDMERPPDDAARPPTVDRPLAPTAEESALIREQVEAYRAELARLRAQLADLSAGVRAADAETPPEVPPEVRSEVPAEGLPAAAAAPPQQPVPPPGTDLARRLAMAGGAGAPVPAEQFVEQEPEHRGPLRRALGWLFAPAPAGTAAVDTAPGGEPDEEEESFASWLDGGTAPAGVPFELAAPRGLSGPSGGPAGAPAEPDDADARTALLPVMGPDPVREQREPTPDPELAAPQADEAPQAEQAPQADEAPQAVPRPGSDLARRLAAANAAASARARPEGPDEPPGEAGETPDPDRDVEPDEEVRPAHDVQSGEDAAPARRRRLAVRGAAHERAARGSSARAVGPPATDSEATAKPRRGPAKILLRTGIAAAFAIVAVVLLRAYVIAPYYIPSASMEPTLHGCAGCHDDRVLVDKLSYRTHDVHRGDVIVFHRPAAWQVPDKVLIKRVIGLPGEELTTRRGVVYVNGLAVDEPYLNTACSGGTRDLPKTVVPDGEYFVLGDNRCDSRDSRTFGPVPQDSVIGRAFMIIWPFGRVHWL